MYFYEQNIDMRSKSRCWKRIILLSPPRCLSLRYPPDNPPSRARLAVHYLVNLSSSPYVISPRSATSSPTDDYRGDNIYLPLALSLALSPVRLLRPTKKDSLGFPNAIFVACLYCLLLPYHIILTLPYRLRDCIAAAAKSISTDHVRPDSMRRL